MTQGLSHLRHVVLDLDGTLYKGARLFACTLPFLETLRKLRIGHTFLTNNTSKSKRDYVAKLQSLGIPATEELIRTPTDSVIPYLRQAGMGKIGVLGTPSLCAQFAESGFTVSWAAPQAVVVGFDTTLTYAKLCRAAYWVAQGVPYLATHPDLVCPSDEALLLPDCGSICAAISAATGKSPKVFGKPQPDILLDLCALLGLSPMEVAMVGDRLYTDIAMAQAAGVVGVLVLSGEATAEAAATCVPGPDLVFADVGELGAELAASRRFADPDCVSFVD